MLLTVNKNIWLKGNSLQIFLDQFQYGFTEYVVVCVRTHTGKGGVMFDKAKGIHSY